MMMIDGHEVIEIVEQVGIQFDDGQVIECFDELEAVRSIGFTDDGLVVKRRVYCTDWVIVEELNE
jgi:hypothetical protein